MKALVVFAHAEPSSFNGAMFRTAVDTLEAEGHEVRTSDLYAMGFDPVSDRRNFTTTKDADYFKQQIEEIHATEADGFAADIEAELEKLEWCDLMIWQFPLWWFGVPAILKGWVDRVFAMGRTYGGGRFYDTGFFRDKKAMVSTTTGGPKAAYEKGGFNGDLDAILRPVHRGVFYFVGFHVLAPTVVYGPAHLEAAEREQQLEAYAERLRQIESESPIDPGSY